LLKGGIEAFPSYGTAYQILGDLHLKRGSNISATFAYFEALKLDPDNALTLLKLGDVFRSEGQLQEAMKYYRSAYELDPESRALTGRLGIIDRQDGSDSTEPFMTETAADLYLQQGHQEKAKAIYAHLLRHDPDNDRLLEKLQHCGG
jgi:tetratricopeptide (TPR) repeat protein